jgi:prepilin-type N-terminal cleavage/methylation domain-containing protein
MTMTMNRYGFTLIELLMAVVIVGLLTAIAIPRVQTVRGSAFIVAMKSDLRNFAVAEESYFYDFQVYAGNVGVLQARGHEMSPGAAVVINEATPMGWSATVSHTGTPVRCYLFTGAAAPIGAATEDGNLRCD